MEEYDMEEYPGVAIFLIALIVFCIGAFTGSIFGPNKRDIICEHYGGEMKADVCIVDNKVFDIG